MRYDPRRMNKAQKKNQSLADQHRDKVLETFKKKQEKLVANALKKSQEEPIEKTHESRQSKFGKKLKKETKDNKRLKAKLRQNQIERRTDRQKIRQLKKTVTNLEAQRTKLQAELLETRRAQAESKQQVKAFYRIRDGLEKSNQAQGRRIQSLSDMNKRVTQNYQKLLRSTEGQELGALRSQNKSLINENQNLKEDIKGFRKRLDNLKQKSKLDQLNNRLSQSRQRDPHMKQASIQQLVSELFYRLDERNVMRFLSVLPLYNRVNYLLKKAEENTTLHTVDSDHLHNSQQLYGYVKPINGQPAFISLDGSIFPGPQVQGNRFDLVENDVYRGNYFADTDSFVINKRYAALTEDKNQLGSDHFQNDRQDKRPVRDTFAKRFMEDHPDAKVILGNKTIRIVTWFKQISYKRLFQPFDVQIDVLDPSEQSGDFIYQRIENVDTDLAFILIEGSHHVNSRIYKDRPAAHPDRIRILDNASPKTLLEMTYNHFKSLETRQNQL